MENTPAAAPSPTSVPDPSGSDADGGAGSEPVDLFRAWCRGLRDGDRGALESVFRALHEPLVRFAARHLAPGDDEAAGDVVQDAFVRIWERRERLDPDRSLKALFFQTVRNLALNRGRDARNRAALLEERYEAPGGAPPRPDAVLDREVLRDRLLGWIEALPERQREALCLSRFDGLDHREIAEVMGCSPRTVNNHLVKALRAIRRQAAPFAPDAETP